jgi:hypothetical protein
MNGVQAPQSTLDAAVMLAGEGSAGRFLVFHRDSDYIR